MPGKTKKTSSSRKQHDFMKICSYNAEFAKKVNIDQDLAREYMEGDKEAGLWQDDDESTDAKDKKKVEDKKDDKEDKKKASNESFEFDVETVSVEYFHGPSAIYY